MKSAPKNKLSLSPLSFEEAVTDILKVKPELKSPKRKPKARKQGIRKD